MARFGLLRWAKTLSVGRDSKFQQRSYREMSCVTKARLQESTTAKNAKKREELNREERILSRLFSQALAMLCVLAVVFLLAAAVAN
jgi:hypothetical protein